MAGYSGTPLAKKLSIKPGFRVALLGAPEHFERTLEPLPENVDVIRVKDRPEAISKRKK